MAAIMSPSSLFVTSLLLWMLPDSGVCLVNDPVHFKEEHGSHVSALRPIQVRSEITEEGTVLLRWRLDADVSANGIRQTHFEIRFKISKLDFDWHRRSEVTAYSGNTTVLCQRVGPISSAKTFHEIELGKLLPHAVYVWQLRVSSEDGLMSSWSEVQVFVTPPQKMEMNSYWIAAVGEKEDAKTTLLRKSFIAKSGLLSAVVSVCGLGQHEMTLNGHRVGQHRLDPGWTDYRKTCLFATHDVTEFIREGQNAIGIILGNGQYNQKLGGHLRYSDNREYSFGIRKLNLMMTLRYDYKGNTFQTVFTDLLWQARQGPITFSNVYGGEDYNALLEVQGWNQVPFKLTLDWKPAQVVAGPGCTLKPQLQPPVTIHEVVHARKITSFSTGNGQTALVYDFGFEFAGWPVLKVFANASEGLVLRLTPSERTDQTGMPAPQWKGIWWEYTVNGRIHDSWRPKFYTSGFRYLLVEATGKIAGENQFRFVQDGDMVRYENISTKAKYWVETCEQCGGYPCRSAVTSEETDYSALVVDGEFDCAMIPKVSVPKEFSVKGEFIYTAAESIGNFSCSNSMINRIHAMALRSFKSNLQSVFSDCPHREKLQWLEQSWLLKEALTQNFDLQSFYKKILRDISDTIRSDGEVPDIAPEYQVFQKGFKDSPEWGSAVVMIPMFLYERYGDFKSLKRYYGNMLRYMNYLASRETEDGLLDFGLGDWTSAGDQAPMGAIASMIYYQGLSIMVRAAKLLNRTTDEVAFEQRSLKARQSIKARWEHTQSGNFSNSQSVTGMALDLGLASNNERSLQWLTKSIEEKGMHFLGGEIGWPYVIRTLADRGKNELLDKMLVQHNFPSYGYMIDQGATTLTEWWTTRTAEGQSWDHAAYGYIDSWFYTHVAGIRSVQHACILLVVRRLSNVEYAEATRLVESGAVHLSWFWRHKAHLHVFIQIPPGRSAQVTLPAANLSRVEAAGQGNLNVSSKVERSNASKDLDERTFEILSGTFSFDLFYATSDQTEHTQLPVNQMETSLKVIE
eukprot:TRINITY_DN7113_c1_g2_i1.p1 TRINITY_DN7113_c1_g2~~TRINITY_DN7113_c1_g2_i1.p1  ORF type:complete len:1021 (-),score=120.91 TRINITY_DN7113_c1_g2_i1:507-3569(-)